MTMKIRWFSNYKRATLTHSFTKKGSQLLRQIHFSNRISLVHLVLVSAKLILAMVISPVSFSRRGNDDFNGR